MTIADVPSFQDPHNAGLRDGTGLERANSARTGCGTCVALTTRALSLARRALKMTADSANGPFAPRYVRPGTSDTSSRETA